MNEPEMNQEINEIYHNCNQTYNEYVKPVLPIFEKERRQKFILAVSLTVCALAIWAILTYLIILASLKYPSNRAGNAIIILLFFAFLPYSKIAQDFSSKAKNAIFPLLLKAFPVFKYTPYTMSSQYTLTNSYLFKDFDIKTDDDGFTGKYKDIQIDIYEIRLEKKRKLTKHFKRKIFSGLMIDLILPQKVFKGRTIISSKNFCKTLPLKAIKEKKIKPINLNSQIFEQQYKVFSTNQTEARDTLTASFMERLQKLQEIFNSKHIKASIHNNTISIAIKTGYLFEITELSKSMLNDEKYIKFFNEICAVIELAIELKSNKNIGL